MIQSMTGYCSSIISTGKINHTLELKCLNSKYLDLNLKLPYALRQKEFELKKIIGKKLFRGKIELLITNDKKKESKKAKLLSKNIKSYIKELKKMNSIGSTDLLKIALTLPGSYEVSESDLSKNNYKKIEKELFALIENVIKFRKKEGKEICVDLKKKVQIIEKNIQEIIKLDSKRLEKKKRKIHNEMDKLNLLIDKNRMEQEMIYYIEKFDINEEITRLNSHLKLFKSEFNNKLPVGKKLGFISQEIGREINTLGAKANDSQIQKIVIEMKDNLEKIKENVLNIL
ncbi:MAG: YicC family protein [Flavobacteriaceae bacterium]|nr:YicC family protein [Flavobacteriaceae bacterium]